MRHEDDIRKDLESASTDPSHPYDRADLLEELADNLTRQRNLLACIAGNGGPGMTVEMTRYAQWRVSEVNHA